MILDLISRLPLYEQVIPRAGKIAAAFAAAAPGDAPFEVREKTYALKEESTRRYEVHFHTIDLMMAQSGAEEIDLCPMNQLERAEALPNGGDGCKLNGAAQRVPTADGSTTILDAVVKGKVTADQVNAQMKKEATESFEYNEDEIVSSDIIGSTAGSIFDATQTKVMDMADGNTLVQVVSWYDNENSYTSQMVRTIKYFSELK